MQNLSFGRDDRRHMRGGEQRRAVNECSHVGLLPLKMASTAPGDLDRPRRQRGCADNGASLRRPLNSRQHALKHAIALDEPMIEGAGDMERDDRRDQNPADEMPDENPVGQRLVLAQ